MEQNLGGETGHVHFECDLYSHFKEMGLVSPNSNFSIDLHPYYNIHEGWHYDQVAMVI